LRRYDKAGLDWIMTEGIAAASPELIGLTSEIIAAYVSNNPVPASGLPQLIADIHAAIAGLSGEESVARPEEKPVPAVSIRKSVTPDFLICLEDGKRFKSLKRHLATRYDLTPEAYRRKWNLPADYPMVVPSYSAARSMLAKAAGVGKKIEQAPQTAIRTPRKRLGLKFT
jgi:predicted transcriptional regulator